MIRNVSACYLSCWSKNNVIAALCDVDLVWIIEKYMLYIHKNIIISDSKNIFDQTKNF